ncbi:MAG: hypothetical protein ACTHOR_09070 [Devosia sp.]
MVEIITVPSSASATEIARGNVIVSGSYGGEYNAWHAAKWGIRGVILNDCGVGRNDAGIKGLPYLDRIGLAGATVDAFTAHIADGEHMLAHGIISHVNEAARRLGCAVGQTAAACAERMKAGPIISEQPPAISGGKRYTLRDVPGEPKVLALDAAPMLTPEDAGAIAITGSHAALFRGQPDNVIGPDLYAVFFNDAGVGLDEAGIRRLPTLDERGIAAGTVSAQSAPIGDARAAYAEGVLSHVNRTAEQLGGRPGMALRDFVELLLARAARR